MHRPDTFIRDSKTITVCHAEAFQLMLYVEDNGPGRAWIWNSRDGVTPFGTSIDGKPYKHAMRGYTERYSAVLPVAAQYVWISYDRASWDDMLRERWQRFRDLPKGDWHDPAEFLERYPDADSFLSIDPFKHGQPRQMTRDEFLASTIEWMGKADQDG